MRLSQKNINELIETLNHRITKIEVNLKWTTRIVGYLAVLLSSITIKLLLS